MKTYRYRDHRGSLIDSLATTVTVANLDALRTHLSQTSLDPITRLDKLVFTPLSTRERMWNMNSSRWETNIVTLDGCAIGYSDGVIPEEAEDMFDTMQYQVEVNGVATNVAEINDVEILRQHLCAAMETIERIDSATNGTLSIIEDYRTDKIKPMTPVDQMIGLVDELVERFDSTFPRVYGYLGVARDKLVSAMDNLKAAKKSPQ